VGGLLEIDPTKGEWDDVEMGDVEYRPPRATARLPL